MIRFSRPRFFAGPALALLLAFCCLLAAAEPARAVSDDPVLRRMDETLAENARLKAEAQKARRRGGEAARRAQAALAASNAGVERMRVQALAHVARVSPGQVEALRKSGHSWGQTSELLGVHPGFLGIWREPVHHPAKRVRRTRKSALSRHGGRRIKRARRATRSRKKIVRGKRRAPRAERSRTKR